MANRPKMSREDRAKQFMPFAALKGYPEALRKKEKMVSGQDETSGDMKLVNTKMLYHDIDDIIQE